ncbi:glycosyltransferase family A protein [Brachybacterium muris]|uniref:glycosyltransferase family A protein n=1 Tax=Brachybacterium muris TaxID=219301 RepID=UPI00223B68D9|nr:glycosyltransferase family A protein [Brachybacterium muris]MCT1653395.1 glycosyltransferase family 2 protein [Brachybacterium muris]
MPSPVAAHPTCSVVVPVKDDAAELRGLLDALARQTVPPLEIVVVDNGSVDDSARIAAQAGCRVLSEPRPGIAAAASTGYDTARGDLILRCDADSRPGPTWVAAHRAAYQAPARRREVVAVTGPARFRLPFPLDIVTSALYLGGYIVATGAALGHVPLFGTTMSMRRTWWQGVRGGVSASAEVHDDMDLSFQVRSHETVRFVRTVAVDMSPRAMRWGSLADVRFRRAFTTLARAWADEKPWERWEHRLRHGRALGQDSR